MRSNSYPVMLAHLFGDIVKTPISQDVQAALLRSVNT